MNNTLLQ